MDGVAVIGYAIAFLLIAGIVSLQVIDIERDGWPARQRRLKADLKRRTRAMRSFK